MASSRFCRSSSRSSCSSSSCGPAARPRAGLPATRSVAQLQVRSTPRRRDTRWQPLRGPAVLRMRSVRQTGRGSRPRVPVVEGQSHDRQQRPGSLQEPQPVEIDPHTTAVVRPVPRTPTPEVLPRRRSRPCLCGDVYARQDCSRRLDGSQEARQSRRPTRSAKASSASMTSWAIHVRLRCPPPARLRMPASSSCSIARWAAESATPVAASA